jgi:hypothetical protein
MNYLQRFSAALAAWETRRLAQGVPGPVETAEGDASPDWLSEVQAVARRLPPAGNRGTGTED